MILLTTTNGQPRTQLWLGTTHRFALRTQPPEEGRPAYVSIKLGGPPNVDPVNLTFAAPPPQPARTMVLERHRTASFLSATASLSPAVAGGPQQFVVNLTITGDDAVRRAGGKDNVPAFSSTLARWLINQRWDFVYSQGPSPLNMVGPGVAPINLVSPPPPQFGLPLLSSPPQVNASQSPLLVLPY
ncbi:uncharacterized protein SPPG_07652 [Spizellomyces punctatus DAOM BR117]|uniref:Uncharacterized protein n=1 Tax=Spizellomyces punctatus (strain DAOM BR117) TaxID=645134 RepID=A0A0L0H9C9_SPIPD|nr:uncharacterized protein SPPG_07652 [Spizellomyces punctatus DAOM BR117]KNC97263.1 hypothetical protein SPPG_07652 [Spizellomyces punctatus DAOM BR117]|eukprot:XP_016605303.1 hypothetical protein SPPG_07652 [Spizellomyces punctatus DAOM BR117]